MANSLVIKCGVGHAHVASAAEIRVVTRVAVSILSHNSAESTIACVESLLVAAKATHSQCRIEIFVSDNASAVEDQRHLKQSLEEMVAVRLKINEKNLGFSAGHNRNLEAIFVDIDPDYIWLLNNDCLVAKTALQALIDCAQKNSEVGIWGATLLEPDGETIQCAGGCFYNPWISSYRQYGRGRALAQIDLLKPVKYDYIAGASLFFSVATLRSGLRPSAMAPNDSQTEQQQWLNEAFFLYFEELDLAKRLKPGIGMAWCKNAMIIHAGGESIGTHENMRSELAEYHSSLGALKFTCVYYPNRLWFMAPARYLLKFVQLSFKGEFGLLRHLHRAYLDFSIEKRHQ